MPDPLTSTKYVELIADRAVPTPLTPFGPGYDVLFDEKIDVLGWAEIRVWVHVFVDNYETTPVTSVTTLELRFMHDFVSSNSFNYEVAVLPWNGVTSYINGYTTQPIIGKELRLICHPVDLPPGPYRLSVTYLLVR